MRPCILFVIRCYWRLTERHVVRTCLFRESCSRYVYRIVQDHGIRAGLAALAARFRSCRGGFTAVGDSRLGMCLRLADGSIAQASELADHMHNFLYFAKFEPLEADDELR